MVNNFKQIRNFLQFKGSDNYYFIQILRLRKDNPRMACEHKHIKEYYIYSLSDLDSVKDEILTTCELARARAYIRLNCRNSEKVLLAAMVLLANAINSKQKMTGSLCRKTSAICNHDPNPKFLINTDSQNDYEFAKETVTKLWKDSEDTNGKILLEVKTPNGIHLVTTPFDIVAFKKICPTINAYEDGSTVLYSPILNTDFHLL